MTFFLGFIDVHAQTITYCNAGHNFPYIVSVRDKTLSYLEQSSLPLGFIENDTYLAHIHHFQDDGLLFFYTDGIIEAMNQDRELYGYPRLESLLLSHCHNDLSTIHRKILENIQAFCRETLQDDDMTMILIQKKHR
jgi:serine phosphatase RsbU (regulator of sigma subunit)